RGVEPLGATLKHPGQSTQRTQSGEPHQEPRGDRVDRVRIGFVGLGHYRVLCETTPGDLRPPVWLVSEVAVAAVTISTGAASAAALPVAAVPIAIAAVPVALATIAVPALAPRLPLPRRPLAPTIAVTLGRLQERLARQLHPVLVVDRDHLYLHLVPDLDHVL